MANQDVNVQVIDVKLLRLENLHLNKFADQDSINFTLSRKQFQLPLNAAKRLMYRNIVLGFAKLLRKKRKAGQW